MGLLEVTGLKITHAGVRGVGKRVLVEGVSFSLSSEAQQGLVLVGESGSGKTLISLALTRLLDPRDGFEISGSVRYNGCEVLLMQASDLQALRGREVAYVFQDPMTALNPYYSIGFQIQESLRLRGISGKPSIAEACELLDAVGLPASTLFLKKYPHELSGGMRQRALIAMALACRPKILVADEPTTSLDSFLQRQIVDLILSLQKRFGMALLFVTHNLALARAVCSEALVLHQGQCVEAGFTAEILKNPKNPYTQKLIHSVPRLTRLNGV